jgi:hypothetical protein
MAENQTPEPEDISGGAQMINQGSTDIDNFLPFGGDNPMGGVTPTYNPSPLRQAFPRIGSLDNSTYPVKDNVTGLAPFTTKPNQAAPISLNDKLDARFAHMSTQLRGLQDNNAYAKIQAYDASSAGAHRARYKAYGQATFDKIGFNPELNNEELFNAGTTGFDDFARWATVSAWPLFSRGFIANPKSYGGLFTGDFGQDIEEAKAYEEYNAIGYSSKGGIGAFMTNALNSFSYTAGIIVEAIAEEALVGGIIGAAGGPQGAAGGTFVGGAMGALKGLAAVPKALFQMGRQGATLAANLRRLDEMSEARRLFNDASSTVGNFLNPFDNTTNAVTAGLNNANNITRLARSANTFGGFYNDVKNINMALSEGRLEGGFVENNTYKELYDGYYAKFGVAPDDQKQREFRDVARKAGADATFYNTLLINYSNKLVIPNVMKGGVLRSLSGYTDDIADFGTHSIVLNPKKGFELVRNNLVTSIKALKNPATYGKVSLNYFKRNITEALQENAQDVISDYLQRSYVAAYNDPAKANHDYAKAILKNAVWKQFSAQGFETFASGFVMGAFAGPLNSIPKYAGIGYNKYIKYAGEYDKYVTERGESGKQMVDTLNQIYNDPKEFFKHRYFNYGNQSLASKIADDDKTTPGEYMDQRDAAFISQMQTVLSTGTMKYFIDQIKSYQQRSPKDVEDALGLAEGEGMKAIQRVDTLVARAKRMERRYDYFKKKVGKNPVDLGLFDKDSDDYKKAALLHSAWEVGVNSQLFMGESFDRNLERIAGITDTFGQISQFSNIPSSAVMPLLDQQRLANEFDLLKSEISVLEQSGKPQTAELSKKKQQLEDLSDFQKSLAAVQLTVIQKEAIQIRKQELIEQGMTPKDAAVQAEQKFEEDFDDLANELISDLKETVTKYLLNLSGSEVEYTKLMNKLQEEGEIEGIDYAMTQLIDLHKLTYENQALVKYINVLQDPVEFAIHVNRNLDWMTEMYNNKTEYFKDVVNNTVEQKEYNDLLQALADKGIYVDLEEFADWIEDKEKLPSQFEDAVNKRVIKKGSILYDEYAKMFQQIADMQLKKPAGEKLDVDGQLKAEIEKAEEAKAAKLAKAKNDYDEKLKEAIGYTEEEYAARVKETTSELTPEQKERLDDLTALKERVDNTIVNSDEDIEAMLAISKDFKNLDLLELYTMQLLALSKDRAGKKKAKEFNSETSEEFFKEKVSDPEEKNDFYAAYYGRYVASTLLEKEIKKLEDQAGETEEDTAEEIVIKEQPAYIEYQEIVAKINEEYEKIFAEIIERYKEKGSKVTSVDDAKAVPAKATITVDTPWNELPKDLQKLLQPKFNEYTKKRKYAKEDAATKAKIRENWLKTPEAQEIVKEYLNAQIGTEEEVEVLLEEPPTLLFEKKTPLELSQASFQELQTLIDSLQKTVNTKQKFDKRTNKYVSATAKELSNAKEDLKNLKAYIAFRRSITPVKPEAERVAAVLKRNILDRQGEVTIDRDSEGQTIGRRLEGIDYEDGEYAARVTQELEDVLQDINPNYEPYLYTSLKPKVNAQTGKVQPSTIDTVLIELDAYITSGKKDKTLDEKVTKLTDLLSTYFKRGLLKRFGSEKKLKLVRERFILNGKATGLELTNDNIKKVIQEYADWGSSFAGTTVDRLGRDFFMDKKLTKPDNMSPEAFKSLLEILNRFANQIRDRNMVVISENMLVFDKDYKGKNGDKKGIVGEMDLLGFREDGSFIIIDMKTGSSGRWDNFNPPADTNVDLLEKANFGKKGILINESIINWKKTGFESIDEVTDRVGEIDAIVLKETYGEDKRGNVTGLVEIEGDGGTIDVEVTFNTDKYTAKGTPDKYSKRPNYSVQQTFYRNAFFNMSGEMPDGIFLLGFQIEADEDGYIKSLKLPEIADEKTMLIELEPVEEVNKYLPLKTAAPAPTGGTAGSKPKRSGRKSKKGTTDDIEAKKDAIYKEWEEALEIASNLPSASMQERERINSIFIAKLAEIGVTVDEEPQQNDIVEYKPKSAFLKDNVGKQILFNGRLGTLVSFPHDYGDYGLETEDAVYSIQGDAEQTLSEAGVSTVRVNGKDVFGDPVVAGEIYEIEFTDESETNAVINGVEYTVERNTKGGVKSVRYRKNDKAISDISIQINELKAKAADLTKQYDTLAKKDPENITLAPLFINIMSTDNKVELLESRRDVLIDENKEVISRDKNIIQALQSLSSTFKNSKGKDEEKDDLESIKNKAVNSGAIEAMANIMDEGYPEKFDMLITNPASLKREDTARFTAYIKKCQDAFEELRVREAAASKLTTDIEKGIAQLGILLNYIKNLEYTQNGKVKAKQSAETQGLRQQLQEDEDQSVIQDTIGRQPGEVPAGKAPRGRKAKNTTELKNSLKAGLTGKSLEELNQELDEENEGVSIDDIRDAFENATRETLDELYKFYMSEIQEGNIQIGDPNLITEMYKRRDLELGTKVDKNSIEVGTKLARKNGKFTEVVQVTNIVEDEYTILPVGGEERVVSLKTLQKYKIVSDMTDEEEDVETFTDETEESAQETPETIADALEDETVINNAIDQTSNMTRAERRAQMAEENKKCKFNSSNDGL